MWLVISALEKLRQKHQGFEASLDPPESLKNKTKQNSNFSISK